MDTTSTVETKDANSVSNAQGRVTSTFRRIALVTLIVEGLVGIWFAARGVVDGGVGWDVGIDTEAAIQVRELTDGMSLSQAYEAVYYTSEWYGVLVQTLADAAHDVVHGEAGYLTADRLDTFQWQAGVTVAIAVFGSVVCSIVIGRVLRSALAGSFVWALLWSLPLWVGMSHLDFKDVPVAVGLTMVSSAFVLLLGRGRGPWDYAGAFCAAAVGSAVAVGVRASSWPLVILILLTFGVLTVLGARHGQRARAVAVGVGIAGSTVGFTLLSLWLTNPLARIDAVAWLADAASTARETALYEGVVRTAGVDVWSRDLPWWYIPAWLAGQFPLATSAVILAGLICFAVALLRPRKTLGRTDAWPLTPFVLQGLVMPLAVVVAGSSLYDGIRHVLFIVPALVALAALPAVVLDRMSRASGRSLVRAAVLGLAVIPLMGLLAIARWTPYEYAYVNEVAGRNTSEYDWELDYWGTTAIEGVKRLNELGETLVSVSPTDFTSKMVGGTTEAAVAEASPRQFGHYQFTRGSRVPLPPGCVQAFTIARDGHVLGEGAVCTR